VPAAVDIKGDAVRDTAGFTLWELLCTLSIAAILLGLGVPSFRAFMLDARRTADVNGFVLAVQVARSEASKRGATVVLCQTFDGLRCGNDELGYGSGWLVFADSDSTRPPQRSDAEPLIYGYRPTLAGTIVGNREYFDFRPIQKRSTNGTLVFCDERGAAAARAVIVSYTGRPRVDTVDPSGQPLVCANSP
jgi:type IV fimbrial biogenesis protein FimT